METQEKSGSFFRFEELRIYAKSTAYCQWLLKNLNEPANEAQRNLFGAISHSAYDIALNIAEGSSRNKSQFDHYLKISKTAIRECYIYTEIARGIGLFNDDQAVQSSEYLMELTRMIGALIISLQRGRRPSDDDERPLSEGEPDDSIDAIEGIDTNF